jgi:hypothetical protein
MRYPLGLVEECCAFGSAYVFSREFPPTPASIAEWCDARLSFHQQLASWKPRPPALPAPEYSDEHCAAMREKIAEIPKVYFRPMGAA